MGGTSEVWDYFKKVENDTKVQCLKCVVRLKFKNTTSNLITHLKTHGILINKLPPKGGKKRRFNPAAAGDNSDDEDDPEEASSTSQSSRSTGGSASASAAGPSQEQRPSTPSTSLTRRSGSFSPTPLARAGPLDKCVNNLTAFAPGGQRDAQCTNALVYMMCKDNLPLNTTERVGFRKFVSTLQPLFKIPSEDSTTQWIDDKYEFCKANVKKMLAKADHIVLTMDIWTQKYTMRSHLGVTAHFTIDGSSHSIELGTKECDKRKTVANLRKLISEFVDEWGIDRSKVRIVVTDGGANIKAAVKAEFGESKHLSCFAHRLNLIGQRIIGNDGKVPSEETEPPPDLPEDENDITDDGQEEEHVAAGSVRELIVKVKKIVRFFKHSELASTKLRTLQKAEMGKTDATALNLINEVKTRWNSCYTMCDRYIQLAPLVNRVCYEIERDKTIRSKPPETLSVGEEEMLKEVRDLLAPLFRATQEVCGDKIMNLSKVIPILRNLNHEINSFLPTSGVGFNMKEQLLGYIREYFGNVEGTPIFAAATLLDPRFKKYGFSQDTRTPIRVSTAIAFVGGLVKQKMIEAEREATLPAAAGPSVPDVAVEEDSFWSAFDKDVESQAAVQSGQDMAGGIPVQLRMFLDRPPVPRKDNPDPLKAWQSIRYEYKHVYAVAEEYLSIVATSVPAERLFSHAGWIAHQRRTRLSSHRLSKLIFLRSLPEQFWF